MKKQIYFIVVIFTSAAIVFSSCKKGENNIASPQPQTSTAIPDVSERGLNPDEQILNGASFRGNLSGYLYTESNAGGGNEILVYEQHAEGSLTLKETVASGGNGVGVFQGKGLDGQGALALSDDNAWLFAVNAGSNSVSSFKVHGDGSLTLADTKSSGGNVPISVCSYHNLLYVVNVASSNICGFTVDGTGTLTKIPGSNLPLSGNFVMAAEIAFSPNGKNLYVTERGTNKITSFSVDGSGAATATSRPSVGVTPFGFSNARDNYMVVSNANAPGGTAVANGSSCTAYGGIDQGGLDAQNGAVADNQTAACWVASTKYGRFAFVTNAGSNSISSYYVSPWGSIYLIHSAIPDGKGPIDITVAANNFYVYNINSASHTIAGYHRTFLGGLEPIGMTPNLPDYATGLVSW